MSVVFQADAFREEFDFDDGTLELFSTGCFHADIAHWAWWFTVAYAELLGGQIGTLLREDEPIIDLRNAAVAISILYGHLRQMGFEPPSISYLVDPTTFLEINAEYLCLVCPVVPQQVETVH